MHLKIFIALLAAIVALLLCSLGYTIFWAKTEVIQPATIACSTYGEVSTTDVDAAYYQGNTIVIVVGGLAARLETPPGTECWIRNATP